MKFILVFFVLSYVFVFFNPKFSVSLNGVRTNNFFVRIAGAIVVAILATLFIGLLLLGIITLFI